MCECVQASLCGCSVPVSVHIWVCISGYIYALCTCTLAHICMIVDVSVFKCMHTLAICCLLPSSFSSEERGDAACVEERRDVSQVERMHDPGPCFVAR